MALSAPADRRGPIAAWPALSGLTPGIAAAGVGLAVLVPLLPFSLELMALRRMRVAAFGTLMALEPGIAVVIGLVLLSQTPAPWQVVGVVLVVIAGIGNLGRALADYAGFTSRGFPVVALVDDDRAKIGTEHVGLTIQPVSELPRVVTEMAVTIGVVATPPGAAQEVTDRLVSAGVSSILNFAPTVLTVPEGVSLRKVDLALELQILSFYQQHRESAPSGSPARRT